MDRVAPEALYAQAAVEMALMDLNGKALGVPAHRLLGGALRDTVELNGWIGIEEPETAAATARDFWRRGYRSAKVQGGAAVESDRDRVAAVRAAVPEMTIRVDGNEGYDVDTAIRLARAIAPTGSRSSSSRSAHGPRRSGADPARHRHPGDGGRGDRGAGHLVAVIRLEAADIVKVKVMKQGACCAVCAPSTWRRRPGSAA